MCILVHLHKHTILNKIVFPLHRSPDTSRNEKQNEKKSNKMLVRKKRKYEFLVNSVGN